MIFGQSDEIQVKGSLNLEVSGVLAEASDFIFLIIFKFFFCGVQCSFHVLVI